LLPQEERAVAAAMTVARERQSEHQNGEFFSEAILLQTVSVQNSSSSQRGRLNRSKQIHQGV
jgi:hypothetical protein